MVPVVQFGLMWAKSVSTIEIHRQLIKAPGDDVMIVQRTRKWRRKLQNGRKDIMLNIDVA